MKKILVIIATLSILFALSCCSNESDSAGDAFTIGYNANGAEHGAAPASQHGYSEYPRILSDNIGNLDKNGYIFAGWNTSRDGNGTDYAPGFTYSGSDVTLYAKWVPIFNYEVISSDSPSSAGGTQKLGASPGGVITGYVNEETADVTIIGLTTEGRLLSDVIIPTAIDGHKVKKIGDNAFAGCTNIESVKIAGTVEFIGDSAFAECINLKKLTMEGATPPATGADVFSNTPVVISVPQNAEQAYKGESGWSTYSTDIIAIGKNYFTVTYMENGAESGSPPLRQVGTSQKTIEICGNTKNMQRTGYTFVGWKREADGSGDIVASGETYAGPNDLVLYAYWKLNFYEVRFDANGGTGTMMDQRFFYGEKKALSPNTFTRDGYVFAGWNTAKDGMGTSYSDGQSVSNLSATNGATVTLYAKWSPLFILSPADDAGVSVDIKALTEVAEKYSNLNIPSEIDGKVVVGLAADAFKNCNNLECATLPDTILYIGEGAFVDCKNLKNLVMTGETPPEIGENVFPANLSTITICHQNNASWESLPTTWHNYNYSFDYYTAETDSF